MIKNNYKFTFCNDNKIIKNKKKIKVFNKKKIITFKDLLTDCKIGLSTVFLMRDIIEDELFPPLKTKEDYVAWLKIAKSKSMLTIFLNTWLIGTIMKILYPQIFSKIKRQL